MSQVKEAIKKYGPWVLVAGGVGFIIWKMSGDDSGPAVIYNSQGATAATVANNQVRAQYGDAMGQHAVSMAQIQAQSKAADAKLALDTQTANNANILALQTLDTQRESMRAQAAVEFQKANAQNTAATGAAYSAVLDSMNGPTYAAINAASQENIAAQMAAAQVAVAGLGSQSYIAAPATPQQIMQQPAYTPVTHPVPSNTINIVQTKPAAAPVHQNFTWYKGKIIDPNAGKLQQALRDAKR